MNVNHDYYLAICDHEFILQSVEQDLTARMFILILSCSLRFYITNDIDIADESPSNVIDRMKSSLCVIVNNLSKA